MIEEIDLTDKKANRRWMSEAACARRSDLHPDHFFIESLYVKNSPEYKAARDKAQAICKTCPVRQPCLEYAIVNDIEDGIWGGLTYSGRRARRYPRRRVDGRLTYIRGES